MSGNGIFQQEDHDSVCFETHEKTKCEVYHLVFAGYIIQSNFGKGGSCIFP